MAWGVDIEPVIAMVSIAFGKHCSFLLELPGFMLCSVPLLKQVIIVLFIQGAKTTCCRCF